MWEPEIDEQRYPCPEPESESASRSSHCYPVIGAGMPIDLNDKHGNPVHIGDTIAFDEKEWGARFIPYVVTIKSGEIQLWGSPSDFPVHCEIVKCWDQTG